MPAPSADARTTIVKVRDARCDAGQCHRLTVSRARYRHWLPIFQKQYDQKSEEVGEPYGLRWQLVAFLIRNVWLAAELDRLGLTDVTADEVRAAVEQRKESFDSDAEYEAYMRASGQTEADLAWRTRMALRAERIEAHVTREADDASEAERMRIRHAKRFIKRWHARTWCRRGYRVKDCRNYAG